MLRSCRQAAHLFIGQHDFTHFANLGNPDPNPVKTIRHFDILPNEHGFVFQVEGSGFMYKMVSLSTLFVLLLPTVKRPSKQCTSAIGLCCSTPAAFLVLFAMAVCVTIVPRAQQVVQRQQTMSLRMPYLCCMPTCLCLSELCW